jgi:deazaflavin-dependent oxidoreductase (nitroreductase family)
VSAWNAKVIDEFRSNGGKVGGAFEGVSLLLLHTTGARTGAERINPLVYQALGDGVLAVFASRGGAPTNPDWYHNLRVNPRVVAEVGTERRTYRARVATGEERVRILAEQRRMQPMFAEYEAKTNRQIPVVVLESVAR